MDTGCPERNLGSVGVHGRPTAARPGWTPVLRGNMNVALALACGLAFFASRMPSGLAQGPDQFKDLIAQLYKGPLKRSQLKQFKQAGTPALDAVLDDFAASGFVRTTLQQLGKNFNPGRAVDRDVYASNVVKVAEAFGSTGDRELVKRQPAAVVRDLGMNTPAFRKLGVAAIKPLLTMKMLQSTPQESEPKLEAWVNTYVDTRKVHESASPGLREGWLDDLEELAGDVVEIYKATWDFQNRLVRGLPLPVRPNVRASYWSDQLSPAVRRRMQLRQLDPSRAR